MREAAAENVLLVAEPGDGEAEPGLQLGEAVADDIAQFDMLEVPPDAFIRIQLRRLPWQPFERHPLAQVGRQEVLHRLRAVNRRPVPDHQQRPVEVAQQMAEELDARRTAKRSLPHLHQEPPGAGDAADHGEVVPRQGGVQDRRLAARGVGAHDGRQLVEAGLIYPDDGASLFPGFA